MAHKWRDIRKQQSPEVEARIKAWVAAELAKLPISELRRARSLTQARMADLLEMDQGSGSKLERRTDMYIRTLRSYIEAMGGQLSLIATFPEGQVEIENIGMGEGRDATSTQRLSPEAEPVLS